MQESKQFAHIAFTRLRGTRAARAHPFDMDFCTACCCPCPIQHAIYSGRSGFCEKSEEVEADFKVSVVQMEVGLS